MVAMTLATQLEILSLGVITKKGPDFFTLFAPIENGSLAPQQGVDRKTFLERWQSLDEEGKGVVNPNDVTRFLSSHHKKDFIGRLIEKGESIFPLHHIKFLAFFLLGAALFRALTLFSHRFLTRLVAIHVSRELRQRYFDHIQELPMDFYQKYHIGHLSSRVVGDAVLIAEAVNACLVNYLQTPFTVFSTLVLCFMASWQLSLFIFLGFPLIIGPIFFLAQRVRKISRQIQKHQEVFASVLLDFLGGIQTVKIFAMEEFSRKKYFEQNHRMAQLEKKSARYDLSSRPVVHTIAMLFLSTTLLYGLYFLKMDVAEVLVFSAFLYLFYEPIKKFAEENAHIQRGIAAAERMTETLEQKIPTTHADGSLPFTTFAKEIVFDRIWFRYDDEWVIRDFSLTIHKGEKIAIVGPTGSGKSTLAQLLPRLYEVEKGEIRIDGTPIRSFQQKTLRENIAFVPQKPFLFLDTIAENISFGRSYSLEEIQQAAIAAHADEFISRLPKNYDTELSEAGKNLSGGQQQRLAIARARSNGLLSSSLTKPPLLSMPSANTISKPP